MQEEVLKRCQMKKNPAQREPTLSTGSVWLSGSLSHEAKSSLCWTSCKIWRCRSGELGGRLSGSSNAMQVFLSGVFCWLLCAVFMLASFYCGVPGGSILASSSEGAHAVVVLWFHMWIALCELAGKTILLAGVPVHPSDAISIIIQCH